MCTVCGCSEGNVQVEGHHHHHSHSHGEHHHNEHNHSHSHEHHHDHSHGQHSHSHSHTGHKQEHNHSYEPVADGFRPTLDQGDLHYGQGAARAHAPGLSQSRMVQIEQDILGKNDRYAQVNRARFQQKNTLVLNLVSSPGSGKTTLLTETLKRQLERIPVAVIEGDQQTVNDADRIRATGARAIQVNTGKGCHLDAHMVGHALDQLVQTTEDQSGSDLENGILYIENVGNLVCPAAFDLGENSKVAILSVTEGEDKPIKYPDMFHAADLMLLNKVDLLPHLDFDVDACIEYARRVNPNIQVIQVSARSGEGMDEWLEWIQQQRRAGLEQQLADLKSKVAGLERQLEAI
ncbi:hydrogenase nickel incorporation protein HypB [Oceanospirillum sediminis]|uniref:Hydrogenase maturation factor HypB n=1 Tax=Oceanospirillum sediminis TaxID=2760088 RepID=A0A839ITA9_9GAMM|nr:hydrogenase nickel incorporation protein HypB [Oceanospirillum sediminis]MBB1488693.1 hydrogenase nickel incorporation protein HypB [Oceanospirillum sediminis]